MNRPLLKLLLLVTILGFAAQAGAADRWETLRAINWVENPTNQTQVGRFGELGPYQFRPATWRMHTDRPFRQAIDRAAADEIAVKHYEWIKRTLAQAGVEPNVFNIAMAWNCGADAVLSGRAPSVSYQYAERVANLVQTFKERAKPVAAEAKAPAPRADEWSLEDRGDEPLRFRVQQDAPHFVLAAL
jgi:hypothetical protein